MAHINGLLGSRGREGVIFFGLDDRFLVKYCTHYLAYGSEYTLALAVRLSELTRYDIKADLTTRGTPTVFCVRIPLEYVDDETLRELGKQVFWAWAYGIARKASDIWAIDFAIDLHRSLSPSHIIEHYTVSSVP